MSCSPPQSPAGRQAGGRAAPGEGQGFRRVPGFGGPGQDELQPASVTGRRAGRQSQVMGDVLVGRAAGHASVKWHKEVETTGSGQPGIDMRLRVATTVWI